jgi:quercetin dioxygenase-like cupin family protein
MEIRPRTTPTKGSAEMFTGEVTLEPIARGKEPSTFAVNAVHFARGARTAWHCHSHGQTLHVTSGVGRVQSRGESIIRICAGDTIDTPADEWHWHGASPDQAMTHLSITEGQATWGDHVTDAEYLGEPAS